MLQRNATKNPRPHFYSFEPDGCLCSLLHCSWFPPSDAKCTHFRLVLATVPLHVHFLHSPSLVLRCSATHHPQMRHAQPALTHSTPAVPSHSTHFQMLLPKRCSTAVSQTIHYGNIEDCAQLTGAVRQAALPCSLRAARDIVPSCFLSVHPFLNVQM